MTKQSPASAAYNGYEYQITASAWAAIELMLARNACSVIVIEPATLEDISASLSDDNEARATLGVEAGPITIQIKSNADSWSKSAFIEILTTREKKGSRGPAPRERAIDMLKKDPSLRYLLITDAPVKSELRDFVVEHIGQASRANAASVPGQTLTDATARRISVMPQFVRELVESRLRGLLESVCHIPLQRVEACRNHLVEAMRVRLLEEEAGEFYRTELLGIVERHGGTSSASRDEFIKPDNYELLVNQLEQPPFVLIIDGPPGVGKTFVAERLVEMHQRAERPFEIVRPSDASAIRSRLRSPGRYLFYLEDPWGSFKLADDAARWAAELPRLIRDAAGSEDKRFLITSRTALLLEGTNSATSNTIDRTLRNAIVTLTADNLDRRARRAILMQSVAKASRGHRDWVDQRSAEIVKALALPHSLVAFAQFAIEQPIERLVLANLLSASMSSAIGHVVAARVRDLGGIDVAVVLWALLSSHVEFDDEQAATTSRALRAGGVDVDLPVVIKRLQDDRWLTRRGPKLIAHPTVVEGLEQLALSVPSAWNSTLSALFVALMGEGLTATAVEIAVRLHGRRVTVPHATRIAIETHLNSCLLSDDTEHFKSTLEALAKLSVANDPVVRIARALTERQKGQTYHFAFSWSPPNWTSDEILAVTASAEAERVTRRYIREVLDAWATQQKAKAFTDFLGSLGWQMAADLAASAIQALEAGSGGVMLQLYGALSGAEPPYDELIQAALARFRELDKWWTDGDGGRAQRAAMQGETDAGYAAFALDDPGDRYHTAREVLKVVVGHRRGRDGYAWILPLAKHEPVVEAWAGSIEDDCGESGRDELLALIDAAGASPPSAVWNAIGRSGCQALLSSLRDLLTEGRPEDLAGMWGALFALVDPPALTVEAGPFLTSLPWPRRASLLFALRDVNIPSCRGGRHRDPEEYLAALEPIVDVTELRAIAECWVVDRDRQGKSLQPGEFASIDDGVLDALGKIDLADQRLAAAASMLRAHNGRPANAVMLLACDDPTVRRNALGAFVAMPGFDRARVRTLLSDRDYTVRRAALHALAPQASAEERLEILQLAEDSSAPVRLECVRVIGSYKWSDGVEVLLGRLSDERDHNEGSWFADSLPNHHVARAAAHGLLSFEAPLPEDALSYLVDFVRTGRRANSDIGVHQAIVDVLVRERDPRIPQLLGRLLRSAWHVGGEKGAFTLRYAAAWAWLDHVLRYPEIAADGPLFEVAHAAGSTDDRLAAPALLGLGACADVAEAQLRPILPLPETSDQRILVLAAGCRLCGSARAETLVAANPRLQAAWTLFDLCWDRSTPVDEVRSRIATDKDLRGWLSEIDPPHPMHAALRFALLRAPNADALPEVRTDDFRSDELPSGTAVLTAFHFAGVE